jgi:hypothetical protein
MIATQLLRLPLNVACHSTGVAGIGAVDEVRSDEADIGRASGMRFLLIIRAILILAELGLYFEDFLLALRGSK